MATKAVTQPQRQDGRYGVQWLAISNTNQDGTAVDPGVARDLTVQVFGTFNGATLSIQGSLDGGTTWATLKDINGNALDFLAAGIKTIAGSPHLIKPIQTAGALTSVDVYIGGSLPTS